MTGKDNSINWFEISVNDLTRARKFYETIFNINMNLMNLENLEMAFFPWEPGSGKVAGALVKSPGHKPGTDGVKIYLNGNPDLSKVLSKVEEAGGKIKIPKTQINEDFGFMAFFIDTEGNAIGLHSQQ